MRSGEGEQQVPPLRLTLRFARGTVPVGMTRQLEDRTIGMTGLEEAPEVTERGVGAPAILHVDLLQAISSCDLFSCDLAKANSRFLRSAVPFASLGVRLR